MYLIKSIICHDDFNLEVMMMNDTRLWVDFNKRKETIRYAMLANIEFFKTASFDDCFIHWDNKIEISIREIISMASMIENTRII